MAADEFEIFYRNYQEPVRRLARRLTGNAADADDVVQEVMLRAGRRGGVDEPAWPWLAVVTRRVVVDAHRRTHRVVPTDDDLLSALAGPAADDPSYSAVRADCRRRLSRALHRLSPGDRELLTRRHVDEIDVATLASAAGVSTNVLRQRLHRVRRRLDHYYRTSGGEAPALVPATGDAASPLDRVTTRISAEVARIAARCTPRPTAPSRPATAVVAALVGATAIVATAPPAGDGTRRRPPVTTRPADAPLDIGPLVDRHPAVAVERISQQLRLRVGDPPPTQSPSDRGVVWERVGSAPPVRHSGAMVYDEARGVTLLFGGSDVTNWLGDTWTWDGDSWTEHHPPAAPSPREGAGIAYDTARRKVVLFGGANASGVLSDTWTWDGSDWEQLSPGDAPSARSHAGLAYDPITRQILLYGGTRTTNHLPVPAPDVGRLNDTWVWDGATWRELRPAATPPEFDHAALAFSADLGRIVLVTGKPGHWLYTWTWEADRWSRNKRFNRIPHPRRATIAMTYHAGLGLVVYLGSVVPHTYMGSVRDDGRPVVTWGESPTYDDLWVSDAYEWQPVHSTLGPSYRAHAMLASDPKRAELILFGGLGESGLQHHIWIATTARRPGQPDFGFSLLHEGGGAASACRVRCRDGIAPQPPDRPTWFPGLRERVAPHLR